MWENVNTPSSLLGRKTIEKRQFLPAEARGTLSGKKKKIRSCHAIDKVTFCCFSTRGQVKHTETPWLECVGNNASLPWNGSKESYRVSRCHLHPMYGVKCLE